MLTFALISQLALAAAPAELTIEVKPEKETEETPL